nr:reverse transcriptase domain-containing protein [Tanacetum cinerariifolium]
MDETNVEDPIHHRIATINLWEDPRRKKQTIHPEDIKEDIKEIIMVENPSNWRDHESEFEKTMREFIIAQKKSNDFVKNQFYNLKTKVKQGQKNHQVAIQDIETKFGRISDHQSSRPSGTLPSNTQTNPKPSTLNEKPYRPPPARNEHMNAEFTRSGMPNYGKFLKDLVSNKSKMEQISVAFLTEECSAILQNKIPPKLGDPRNFVLLQMEEDDRVPRILGRPFLHTADAVLRVKNKELNLGIGEDRATFHIDKAMRHSHVNDNTCFRMDVIDKITEDELDDLLDDYKPFLNT